MEASKRNCRASDSAKRRAASERERMRMLGALGGAATARYFERLEIQQALERGLGRRQAAKGQA